MGGFATPEGVKVSKYLMEHYNIDINATTQSEESALSFALEKSNTDGIEMILSDKYIDLINVHSKPNEVNVPPTLLPAVFNNNHSAMDKLLNSGKFNFTNEEINNTFLCVAKCYDSDASFIQTMWKGIKYLVSFRDIDVNYVYTDTKNINPFAVKRGICTYISE